MACSVSAWRSPLKVRRRPEDVLEALSLRDLLEKGDFLTRVNVELDA